MSFLGAVKRTGWSSHNQEVGEAQRTTREADRSPGLRGVLSHRDDSHSREVSSETRCKTSHAGQPSVLAASSSDVGDSWQSGERPGFASW